MDSKRLQIMDLPTAGAILLAVATTLSANEKTSEKHWAFQPIEKPAVPLVVNEAWPRNPIDSFILARLEKAGLEPPTAAKPRELTRRLYFDLIGLPPPPDSADTNPESLIETLLRSPHYGERWGRHWLDVVRYADSNGLDENAAHANAWRYRDFVVHNFNRDTRFDQFLIMQIAGDLLPSENDAQRFEQTIATGFLSLGPKVLAEPDQDKLQMDIIDEQVDTIGRALLGLTLGCARCHDHKFDPIPTEEYYALAGIFKSTKTMQSLKRVAIWHENPLRTAEEEELKKKHEALITSQKQVIAAFKERANQELLVSEKWDQLPEAPGDHYPEATREELGKLEATLDRLKSTAPKPATAMGVTDGDVTDLPVFVRGDYNSPGEVQRRRFPSILTTGAPRLLDKKSSGRRELAEWIASPENPLTARVLVNRIWRWHFGRGLVPTPDNFGLLGEPPTHPELLDWLAAWFLENNWSVKELHRLILNSATYSMSTTASVETEAKDPTNTLYSRAPLRRLEAEPLRDTLLEIAGLLDRQVGGYTWTFPNRKLVFDHESRDATTYQSNRRAIYLPVIRNNVYGPFELFDFPDPATVGGNRTSSVVAPQALFLMNSSLVLRSTLAVAEKLVAQTEWDDTRRVEHLFSLAYGRPPVEIETDRALEFLQRFTALRETGATATDRSAAWQALCQAIISANEFLYLR